MKKNRMTFFEIAEINRRMIDEMKHFDKCRVIIDGGVLDAMFRNQYYQGYTLSERSVIYRLISKIGQIRWLFTELLGREKFTGNLSLHIFRQTGITNSVLAQEYPNLRKPMAEKWSKIPDHVIGKINGGWARFKQIVDTFVPSAVVVETDSIDIQHLPQALRHIQPECDRLTVIYSDNLNLSLYALTYHNVVYWFPEYKENSVFQTPGYFPVFFKNTDEIPLIGGNRISGCDSDSFIRYLMSMTGTKFTTGTGNGLTSVKGVGPISGASLLVKQCTVTDDCGITRFKPELVRNLSDELYSTIVENLNFFDLDVVKRGYLTGEMIRHLTEITAFESQQVKNNPDDSLYWLEREYGVTISDNLFI